MTVRQVAADDSKWVGVVIVVAVLGVLGLIALAVLVGLLDGGQRSAWVRIADRRRELAQWRAELDERERELVALGSRLHAWELEPAGAETTSSCPTCGGRRSAAASRSA
jgi:hypothetical protein